VNVWLVNTGWSGGAYGTGHRMSLKITRALISAALDGKLNHVEFEDHDIFRVAMPMECEGVPTEVLNPRNTWADKEAYDNQAVHLASLFLKNFEKFSEGANTEILEGAPTIKAHV
jgi:phosphoenolpyruvate carboxykinase (ATP)